MEEPQRTALQGLLQAYRFWMLPKEFRVTFLESRDKVTGALRELAITDYATPTHWIIHPTWPLNEALEKSLRSVCDEIEAAIRNDCWSEPRRKQEWRTLFDVSERQWARMVADGRIRVDDNTQKIVRVHKEDVHRLSTNQTPAGH